MYKKTCHTSCRSFQTNSSQPLLHTRVFGDLKENTYAWTIATPVIAESQGAGPWHQNLLRLTRLFQCAAKFRKLWAWRYLLMRPYSTGKHLHIQLQYVGYYADIRSDNWWYWKYRNPYEIASSEMGKPGYFTPVGNKKQMSSLWVLLHDLGVLILIFQPPVNPISQWHVSKESFLCFFLWRDIYKIIHKLLF